MVSLKFIRWSVVSGQLSVVSGTGIGRWLLVFGLWSLVLCLWLLVFALFALAFGISLVLLFEIWNLEFGILVCSLLPNCPLLTAHRSLLTVYDFPA